MTKLIIVFRIFGKNKNSCTSPQISNQLHGDELSLENSKSLSHKILFFHSMEPMNMFMSVQLADLPREHQHSICIEGKF